MPPAKPKVNVTALPTNRRPSSSERRAMEIASLSGKQEELKRQSAERRAQRAAQDATPSSDAPAPPSRSS